VLCRNKALNGVKKLVSLEIGDVFKARLS